MVMVGRVKEKTPLRGLQLAFDVDAAKGLGLGFLEQRAGLARKKAVVVVAHLQQMLRSVVGEKL